MPTDVWVLVSIRRFFDHFPAATYADGLAYAERHFGWALALERVQVELVVRSLDRSPRA